MIETTLRTRAAFLAAQVGSRQPVLFESRTADGMQEGYTPNYTPVRVRADEPLAGSIREVRIVSAHGDWCEGELPSQPPTAVNQKEGAL
ncbi:MAG: TRAM domain-containing protein [Anaerotruncus massiliensis (ex Togo et al. 2019)]